MLNPQPLCLEGAESWDERLLGQDKQASGTCRRGLCSLAGPHLEARLAAGWRNMAVAVGISRSGGARVTGWPASQSAPPMPNSSRFPWEPGGRSRAFASCAHFSWALSPPPPSPHKAPGSLGAGLWEGSLVGVTVERAGPPFHAARLLALEHPARRPAPGPTGGPHPTPGSMEPRTVRAPHPRSSACIQRSLEVPAVTGEKKGGSVPWAAVGRLWARARRRLRSAGCSPAHGAERGCRTVRAPPEPHAKGLGSSALSPGQALCCQGTAVWGRQGRQG